MVANNKSQLIVTGSTGFIGKNLVKLIHNLNYSFIPIYRDTDLKKLKIETSIDTKLIHLATFYSKEDADKEKIYDSNIVFGKKVLEIIKNFKINNFIYTNTMFSYQNENNHFYYTKTKNEFSELIRKEVNKECVISEIFLDNTFGPGDDRNKVINNIIKNVKSNQASPVTNKEAFLNLTYIEDVCKCLINELNSPKSEITRITSSKDYKLESIFNFLKYYLKSGESEEEILESKDSRYAAMTNVPKINTHYVETNFIKNLIKSSKLN